MGNKANCANELCLSVSKAFEGTDISKRSWLVSPSWLWLLQHLQKSVRSENYGMQRVANLAAVKAFLNFTVFVDKEGRAWLLLSGWSPQRLTPGVSHLFLSQVAKE